MRNLNVGRRKKTEYQVLKRENQSMETEYRVSSEKIENKANLTSDRKLAHIQICLEHDVQGRNITTGLEDIAFVHHATTDLNLNEIDLSTEEVVD